MIATTTLPLSYWQPLKINYQSYTLPSTIEQRSFDLELEHLRPSVTNVLSIVAYWINVLVWNGSSKIYICSEVTQRML